MPKGKLTFEYNKCKGCLLCIEYCPKKILTVDTGTMNVKGYNVIKVTEPDKCIACTFCATMCPDSVITVERVD